MSGILVTKQRIGELLRYGGAMRCQGLGKYQDGDLNATAEAVLFNLYYGEGGTVSKSSPKFTGTLSPFSLTGLKNDIVYAFALTSVDANGETELGTSLMAIPRLPPPGAPTLGAVTSGDKQVTVIWTDQIVASSYILYYKAGTAVDKTSSNKVSIVSPYVLSGLTNGTIYAFALSAITPAGETELSNIMTTTPHLPD
jgi:chondroitin AC lyase